MNGGRKNIKWIILRQIPFFLIFRNYYLISSLSSSSSSAITGRLKALFFEGHFGQITPLFTNIGNLLISDKLQESILHYLPKDIFILSLLVSIFYLISLYLIKHYSKQGTKLTLSIGILIIISQVFFIWAFNQNNYWFKDTQAFFSTLVGMDTLLFSFYIGLIFWKKRRLLSILLLFSIIVILTQVFGYYAQYWDQIIPTIHRYFLYPFIGVSILYGSLSYILYIFLSKKNVFGFGKYIALVPIFVLVSVNALLNFTYQFNFIKNISMPSKIFYSNLHIDVPSINKGDLFYFDVDAETYYQNQFAEFFSVGSMPNETTLAYYYNIPVQDVKITTDYNAIPSLINGKKISINNIHSFFWGPKGLTDTTNDLKERLLSKKEKIIISRDIISSSTIQMVKNGSDFGQDIVLTLPDLGIN